MGAGVPSFVREVDGKSRLAVRVQPGARRTAVIGTHGNALKVSVTSPPDRGKANEALLGFLARVLGLPASSLELVRGHASRDKTVVVPLPAAEVARRLS